MSRRVYVETFFDVNGVYTKIESVKNLKEIEWQVKKNKHNIEMLNNNLKPNIKEYKDGKR